jgi:hypothetical protein
MHPHPPLGEEMRTRDGDREARERRRIVGVGGLLLVLATRAWPPGAARAEDLVIACGKTAQQTLASPGESDRFGFVAGGGETVAVTTGRSDAGPLVPC